MNKNRNGGSSMSDRELARLAAQLLNISYPGDEYFNDGKDPLLDSISIGNQQTNEEKFAILEEQGYEEIVEIKASKIADIETNKIENLEASKAEDLMQNENFNTCSTDSNRSSKAEYLVQVEKAINKELEPKIKSSVQEKIISNDTISALEQIFDEENTNTFLPRNSARHRSLSEWQSKKLKNLLAKGVLEAPDTKVATNELLLACVELSANTTANALYNADPHAIPESSFSKERVQIDATVEERAEESTEKLVGNISKGEEILIENKEAPTNIIEEQQTQKPNDYSNVLEGYAVVENFILKDEQITPANEITNQDIEAKPSSPSNIALTLLNSNAINDTMTKSMLAEYLIKKGDVKATYNPLSNTMYYKYKGKSFAAIHDLKDNDYELIAKNFADVGKEVMKLFECVKYAEFPKGDHWFWLASNTPANIVINFIDNGCNLVEGEIFREIEGKRTSELESSDAENVSMLTRILKYASDKEFINVKMGIKGTSNIKYKDLSMAFCTETKDLVKVTIRLKDSQVDELRNLLNIEILKATFPTSLGWYTVIITEDLSLNDILKIIDQSYICTIEKFLETKTKK